MQTPDPKLVDSLGKWGVGTIAMVGVMMLAYFLGIRFLDQVAVTVEQILEENQKQGLATAEFLVSEQSEEEYVLRIARALEKLSVTHEKWRENDRVAMEGLRKAGGVPKENAPE